MANPFDDDVPQKNGWRRALSVNAYGDDDPTIKAKTKNPFDDEVPPVSVTEDAAKSFGSGLVKGAVGMLTMPQTFEQFGTALNTKLGGPMLDPEGLPSQALRRIAGALPAGGWGLSPAIRAVVGGQPNITNDGVIRGVENIAGPLHKPATTPGKYAQTVGEFASGGFGPGSIGRKVASVALPAVTSETAGQLTEGTRYEPAARAAGAIGGAFLPNALARTISPFPSVGPEHARAVAVLRNEGVPLTAGDATGRKSLRWAESVANDVPFAGARTTALKTEQLEKFTESALKRAGINARRATDDVIDDAFTTRGAEFENIASSINVLPISPNAVNRIRTTVSAYDNTIEPSFRSGLPAKILADLDGAPALSGAQYGALRSQLGQAARGTQDPRTRDVLYKIQHQLDDAAEVLLRSRPGQQTQQTAARMKSLRKEYRNLLVIAKARGAGEEGALGLISPQQLQVAAKQMEGWQQYARGRGDFTQLAKAGNAVMSRLPNSGTAPRLAAQSMMMIPGALAGGAYTGDQWGALGGVLAQGLTARGLMSRPMQRILANQTMTPAAMNSQIRTSIPYSGLLGLPRYEDDRR